MVKSEVTSALVVEIIVLDTALLSSGKMPLASDLINTILLDWDSTRGDGVASTSLEVKNNSFREELISVAGVVTVCFVGVMTSLLVSVWTTLLVGRFVVTVFSLVVPGCLVVGTSCNSLTAFCLELGCVVLFLLSSVAGCSSDSAPKNTILLGSGSVLFTDKDCPEPGLVAAGTRTEDRGPSTVVTGVVLENNLMILLGGETTSCNFSLRDCCLEIWTGTVCTLLVGTIVVLRWLAA